MRSDGARLCEPQQGKNPQQFLDFTTTIDLRTGVALLSFVLGNTPRTAELFLGGNFSELTCVGAGYNHFGTRQMERRSLRIHQRSAASPNKFYATLRIMDFYSARLLFIILVADGPGRKRNHYDESVVVFRARNFDRAFRRALELGRAQETDYKNSRGQRVRWALVEIRNIDLIGPKVDGKEVASVLHYRTSRERIPPNRLFHPERLKPEQSF